jgi:hypothetical protein
MGPYPKINSLYKRDPNTNRIVIGDFAQPEFEFLADVPWLWTEKVDGTNIRIGWEPGAGPTSAPAYLWGRTDNAQLPPKLARRLSDLWSTLPWADVFDSEVCLYGEGYGAGIQKGGGNYIPDGVDFVLFDVLVAGRWWLGRADVEDVATKLGLDVVPIVTTSTIPYAERLVLDGAFMSKWPGVYAEGLVGRPVVDLYSRKGERITTKIKRKDYS